MPARPKLVRSVCDKTKLVHEVNELCKLVERVSEIDYKSKTQYVISVCGEGTGNEQLDRPSDSCDILLRVIESADLFKIIMS